MPFWSRTRWCRWLLFDNGCGNSYRVKNSHFFRMRVFLRVFASFLAKYIKKKLGKSRGFSPRGVRTCILLFAWFRVLIIRSKHYFRALDVENGNIFLLFHFMLNKTFLFASLSASSFSLLVFVSNHYFVSSHGIKKTVFFCLLCTICPLAKKLAKSVLSILSHEAI